MLFSRRSPLPAVSRSSSRRPSQHAFAARTSARSGALTVAVLVLSVVVIGGCSGSRRASDRTSSKPPTPSPASTAAPSTSAPGDVSTGVTPPAMTLSERLAVLDARIKTAPADSLPHLFAEYHRLLALRNGERVAEEPASNPRTGSTPFPMSTPTGDSAERRRRLAEGQSHDWSGADTARLVDIPMSTEPRSSTPVASTPATPAPSGTSATTPSTTPSGTNTATLSESLPSALREDIERSSAAAPTTPATTTATTTATSPATTSAQPAPKTKTIASGDPSKIFKGLRPSEIATIPGHERSKAATSTRRSTSKRAVRRVAVRRAPERSERVAVAPRTRSFVAAPSTRPAESINSRGQRKGMVSGIAAARAGKYAEAVTKLAPSIASGKASADARYYYALSLEKTGQASRAADEYLKASRGSGATAQRAYLDYCRMLARTGGRDKARQLLTQFLRRNGEGSQAVAARKLLQTL